MSMIKLFASIMLGFMTTGSANAASPTSTHEPAQPSAADADFVRLAKMEGEWKNAEKPDSALRIRFALTAGGTVLQESWLVGDRLHSLTIYHRDGDRLVLTHYCPQGNQPTLVQTQSGPSLGFTFRSANDLDPATEDYLHDLSFDLSNPDRSAAKSIAAATAMIPQCWFWRGPTGRELHMGAGDRERD